MGGGGGGVRGGVVGLTPFRRRHWLGEWGAEPLGGTLRGTFLTGAL